MQDKSNKRLKKASQDKERVDAWSTIIDPTMRDMVKWSVHWDIENIHDLHSSEAAYHMDKYASAP